MMSHKSVATPLESSHKLGTGKVTKQCWITTVEKSQVCSLVGLVELCNLQNSINKYDFAAPIYIFQLFISLFAWGADLT